MPGVAGAKEVYGISRMREGGEIVIPPRALVRYGIVDGESVILTTSHIGEAGFGLLVEAKARRTILRRRLESLTKSMDLVQWIGGRAHARTSVNGGRIRLSQEMMDAFLLEPDERLLVVKGAAVAMGFIPVEIWRKKLEKAGFAEAIERMDSLEEF